MPKNATQKGGSSRISKTAYDKAMMKKGGDGNNNTKITFNWRQIFEYN